MKINSSNVQRLAGIVSSGNDVSAKVSARASVMMENANATQIPEGLSKVAQAAKNGTLPVQPKMDPIALAHWEGPRADKLNRESHLKFEKWKNESSEYTRKLNEMGINKEALNAYKKIAEIANEIENPSANKASKVTVDDIIHIPAHSPLSRIKRRPIFK